MPTSLFSTYSQGENRITATFLAVLERLALPHIEFILGALLDEPEFSLISFQNQPSKGGPGVPDAQILAAVRVLIETKVRPRELTAAQLSTHLQRLNGAIATERLLVLTPDADLPPQIAAVADTRLAWASFVQLNAFIEELIVGYARTVSEREIVLLTEFQNLMLQANLLTSPDDTVVVAAKTAWGEYQRLNAYIHQPNRTYRAVERLAFYAKQHIQPLVPKVLATFPAVMLEVGVKQPDPRLTTLVKALLTEQPHRRGQTQGVFLLSEPTSPDTLSLASPILNDQLNKHGALTAYTAGQRYTRQSQLERVAKLPSDQRLTSALDFE
jgi:hypothetical protein